MHTDGRRSPPGGASSQRDDFRRTRSDWESLGAISGIAARELEGTARFVERHQDAIAGLFGEVLSLCAKQGLASVGVIAVDGSKVAGNASRNANVDYEQIAREILEEARAVDAVEDELYGGARGDELPEQLRTGEGRRASLREAKRQLEEQRAKGRGRFRGTAASASRKPGGAWTRSCGPSCAPTAPTSTTAPGA